MRLVFEMTETTAARALALALGGVEFIGDRSARGSSRSGWGPGSGGREIPKRTAVEILRGEIGTRARALRAAFADRVGLPSDTERLAAAAGLVDEPGDLADAVR